MQGFFRGKPENKGNVDLSNTKEENEYTHTHSNERVQNVKEQLKGKKLFPLE